MLKSFDFDLSYSLNIFEIIEVEITLKYCQISLLNYLRNKICCKRISNI